MTAPELAALNAAVADRKARGLTTTFAQACAEAVKTVTLTEATEMEAARFGHVEFFDGEPRWVLGPARFPGSAP